MTPLPTKVLGTWIHELRQAAGLSLRDLGGRLRPTPEAPAISAAFLSDIENGHRYPSDELIEKIAEVLGADLNELKRSDPRPPTREIQDLAMINPQFAFAFRRAVEVIRNQQLTPQEFIQRMEAGIEKWGEHPTKPDVNDVPLADALRDFGSAQPTTGEVEAAVP